MAILNTKQIKSVLIALLYGLCVFFIHIHSGQATISMLITFINRAVFYSYKFNFPLLLSASQMVFSLIFLMIFGAIFHMFPLPPLTVESIKKVWVPQLELH